MLLARTCTHHGHTQLAPANDVYSNDSIPASFFQEGQWVSFPLTNGPKVEADSGLQIELSENAGVDGLVSGDGGGLRLHHIMQAREDDLGEPVRAPRQMCW